MPTTVIGVRALVCSSPDLPGRIPATRRLAATNTPFDLILGTGGYGQVLRAGNGLSTAYGNPAPGYALGCGSQPMGFRLPVSPGTRIVKVDFLQPGLTTVARPRMTVRANPEIGIPADVYVDGAAGSAWATVSITLSITKAGGIWVLLYNAGNHPNIAYADNLTVT